MLQLKFNELIRNSCIGRRVTAVLDNSSVYRGVLNRLTPESIGIIDGSTNLEISLAASRINSLVFEGLSSRSMTDDLQLLRFKKGCEKKADEKSLSFGSVFADEIRSFMLTCREQHLSKYLEAEIGSTAAKYTVPDAEYLYEILRRTNRPASVSAGTYSLIEMMLLMRMRRFDMAFGMSTDAAGGDIERFCAVQYCLAAGIRHLKGVLYWMGKWLRLRNDDLLKDENILWLFLKLSSQFSRYDEAFDVICRLIPKDPTSAVNSIAYLLALNNNSAPAKLVLEYTLGGNPVTAEEASAIVDNNTNYLVSDRDNNYHRYLRCVDAIFKKESFSSYGENEDVSGYVYDFIPDRGFGFIIGFDLIPYFFRNESIASDHIRSLIRKNICSFIPVDEEQMITATFRRSAESKRSYNAIEIV